jgi:hypothetical protein
VKEFNNVPGDWGHASVPLEGVEVGRILNLSGPGVTKSVEKGKRIISADESLRRKLIS